MSSTSRELVIGCLRFAHPDRIPRDLWVLPWATERYPDTFAKLKERYPSDFAGPAPVYRPSPRIKGNPFAVGEYIDEWGCIFTNIQEGVIGEARTPIVEEISDWRSVEPPYETLPADTRKARDAVNRSCAETDKFVMGSCCPRPWERYQFIRGTLNSMMDVATLEDGARKLLRHVHDFYLKELEFWVSTDVDGITFMDDWGAQDRLLISPQVWRDLFKPLYRDYCDLAHSAGKFAFMHSDGFITPILEDLIEVGVDAINSQLFCMDLSEVARIGKSRITFWGEIDRQHVLTSDDPEVGRSAVREVARHLYDPSGGVIAQFEFGPGINPETSMVIFDEWERVERGAAPAG